MVRACQGRTGHTALIRLLLTRHKSQQPPPCSNREMSLFWNKQVNTCHIEFLAPRPLHHKPSPDSLEAVNGGWDSTLGLSDKCLFKNLYPNFPTQTYKKVCLISHPMMASSFLKDIRLILAGACHLHWQKSVAYLCCKAHLCWRKDVHQPACPGPASIRLSRTGAGPREGGGRWEGSGSGVRKDGPLGSGCRSGIYVGLSPMSHLTWAALICISNFAGADLRSPIGATASYSEVVSSCLLYCAGYSTGLTACLF